MGNIDHHCHVARISANVRKSKRRPNGRDANEKSSNKREMLLKKTRFLYEQKESIHPEDRRLYHKPVKAWENATNKRIRDWINLAKPLTKTTKKTI
jgi:hypothetical protein